MPDISIDAQCDGGLQPGLLLGDFCRVCVAVMPVLLDQLLASLS